MSRRGRQFPKEGAGGWDTEGSRWGNDLDEGNQDWDAEEAVWRNGLDEGSREWDADREESIWRNGLDEENQDWDIEMEEEQNTGRGTDAGGRASGRNTDAGGRASGRNADTGRDRNGRASGRRRPQSRAGKRGRRKSRRNDRMPVLAAAVFITVVILLALLSMVIKKYSPSKERADLNEYYQVQSEEDMAIILDGQRLEETAKYWDGHVYMDYKLAQQYLNQRFYWDSNENILRYVTDVDVISVNAGSTEYIVTKKNESTDYVIVKVDGENMYLALDFVQKYTNIDFAMYQTPNRVKITASWGEVQTASIRKKTEIRVKGGIKSPIVADLEKESKVTVLEEGEDWSKVCTEDGMIGWLRNKRLGEINTETLSREFEEPVFSHMLKDGPVSMGWHQVTTQEANERISNVLQSTPPNNVTAWAKHF